jgi:glycosyltransferase involved in cell wall biosynthesis
MTKRPHVVYWGTQPSPYVVDRFNAVADTGELQFEAWFNQIREPDRSWNVDPTTWRFPTRLIQRGPRPRLPVAELRHARPDVLVQNFDRPHFALGFAAGTRYAKRGTFRVLPTFEAWSSRRPVGEMSKHLLFRAVDGAKVPGPGGTTEATKYGLPAERCFKVTQSINLRHFASARDVETTVREARRAELGLRGTVFVYVGRLWSGKGLGHLIEAFRRATASSADISLLIVGDGVDEQEYRRATSDMPAVLFAGHVQPADLPEWYALSDCFVFPTLGDPNGLVVEEAMAAGLPVISTSAAGDIRLRVAEGVSGYIVEPADSGALADRMLRFASLDGPAREALRRGAIQHASGFDVPRYAADFVRFIEAILAMPPRRTPARLAAKCLGVALLPFATATAAPLLDTQSARHLAAQ